MFVLTRPIKTDSAFANLLVQHRSRINMSQGQLALHVNVNHSIISRWESGQRIPTHKNVLNLSTALLLNDVETCTLEILAGYMPNNIHHKKKEQAESLAKILLTYKEIGL